MGTKINFSVAFLALCLMFSCQKTEILPINETGNLEDLSNDYIASKKGDPVFELSCMPLITIQDTECIPVNSSDYVLDLYAHPDGSLELEILAGTSEASNSLSLISWEAVHFSGSIPTVLNSACSSTASFPYNYLAPYIITYNFRVSGGDTYEGSIGIYVNDAGKICPFNSAIPLPEYCSSSNIGDPGGTHVYIAPVNTNGSGQ